MNAFEDLDLYSIKYGWFVLDGLQLSLSEDLILLSTQLNVCFPKFGLDMLMSLLESEEMTKIISLCWKDQIKPTCNLIQFHFVLIK
jgi:hypothetical protein